MPKFPTHKKILPNFLRPTLEVVQGKEKALEDAEYLVLPLPGESAFLHAAREIHARMELQLTKAALAPPIVIGLRDRPMTITETVMRCEEARLILESRSPLYGCFAAGTCMPHRPEPPLRKTVHSTVLEQKQLT